MSLQSELETLQNNFGSWDAYQKHCDNQPELVRLGLMGFNTDPEHNFQVRVEVLKQFCGNDKDWAAYLAKVRKAGEALGKIEPPPPSEAKPQQVGKVEVVNVLSDGYQADPRRKPVYIGRAALSYGFPNASPLQNKHTIKGRSIAARDAACTKNIEELIIVLNQRSGPEWEEIKRLSLLLRSGANIELLCFCAPLRCHGNDIAYIISAFANRATVTEVLEGLKSRVTAHQTLLKLS